MKEMIVRFDEIISDKVNKAAFTNHQRFIETTYE